MRSVDPNAPTEENEPVRMPARILPRDVVMVVGVCAFVLTLLTVVAVANAMALSRR